MAQVPFNIEMDVDIDMIRERSTLNSKASLRSSSIYLSTSSVLYHWHMKINNTLPDIKSREPIDSSQLSYKENEEIGNSISMTTDKPSPKEGQHVYNEALALKSTLKPWGKGMSNNNTNMSSLQDVINI